MVVWRILGIVCIMAVYVESKSYHQQKRDIESSICSPLQNATKLQCFCGRWTHMPEQVGDAECFQTEKNVSEDDPSWEGFKALENTTKLTLTSTKGIAMTYIPTKALRYTKALHRLNIKYCNIERVQPFAFANLSLVEDITLRDNQVKSMAPNAFAHHIRVKTISLDQNNIAEINRDVFVDLPSLEQLFLTGNKITIIHDKAFVHLINLKELEIDKNSLFSLNSDTFFGLSNLEKLELSSNNLEVIGDNTFSPLMNLRFLNLAENKIQMLDEKAFNGLTRLQLLSLAHNKLTAVENGKVFDGLESLISLNLKDNKISVIKPDAIAPILSNFYGKTAQFTIEGNMLACDCSIDVFKTLMNKTQNERLVIELQNLQCYPNEVVKQKWDMAQENEKNAGQVFEDDVQQTENGAYEYYDDSELNGTLFYFDMRYILHCPGGDESQKTIGLNSSGIPENKFKNFKNHSAVINTKATSSHDSNIKAILTKSTTEFNAISNRGILDLSEAESTTSTEPATERHARGSDTTSSSELTRNKYAPSGKNEIRDNHKEHAYTTSKLVTVSVKPIENKHYPDHDMASDEAQPDTLKAHRSFQDVEASPKFKVNNAYRSLGSLPLIISLIICFRILF